MLGKARVVWRARRCVTQATLALPFHQIPISSPRSCSGTIDSFDHPSAFLGAWRPYRTDAGDLGRRYTPEMLEILQKALGLRKKWIIKF